MNKRLLLFGMSACFFLSGTFYGSAQNLQSTSRKKTGTSVSGQTVGTLGLPAQTPAPSGAGGTYDCATDQFTQQYYESIGVWQDVQQDYLYHADKPVVPPIAKTPGANTIAIIFHVVYNPNNPAENVSYSDIMNVYNDISEDYQLLNADAGNARPGFTPADANINFCLATQTPAGVPLPEVGVIRVSTTEDFYDSDNGEENKMKSSSTGGSDPWDRTKYLNVWICDITNGANSGTAGYAYRPTTSFLPSAAIDGIVIDYNLGVNNDNILTHEIGHYLGLDHTWGGSGGCGNDDGFSDTPNTAGPSFNYPGSCSGSQTTCSGVQTMYENYMDYSNCTVMFTQMQANYMLSILNGIRSSLLSSPGCNSVAAPPVADFTADVSSPIIIPVGGTINFTDVSTNSPTSWSWDFGGGATNVTVQNPSVTFNTVGTYTISLTATNSFGSDTEVKTGFVQVVAASSGTACDTLRNWDPADAAANGFYYYNSGGSFGYFPGHNEAGGATYYSNQYAEKLSYTGSAQVRRIAMPFFIADDQSGSGTMVVKIWSDASGSPGTLLASETVNIADIDEGFWNEFDFSSPPTVTGTFWAGFQLFYGSPQDTVLVGMTDTRPGGNDSYFIDITGLGWSDGSTAIGITGSIAIDVMLSNGPAPVADFTYSDTTGCVGGTISVNGSTSTNTTGYTWYYTDNPITTILDQSTNASATFSLTTAGPRRITLFAEGSCMTDGIFLPFTVYPTVSATATPTATSCGLDNGSITVSAMAGGTGSGYEFSLDGTNYQTSATFPNLAAGNYTVYVRTPGANCGNSYSVTVGSSSGFTAGISPNTAICSSQSATLTATGGTSYEWYDGSTQIGTTASIVVNPSASTQYYCVVTNAAGCQSTQYVDVTVTQTDNASFQFFDFCFGSANQATSIATPGGTFAFNPAPSDGATINATTGEISNETLGSTYSVEYTTSGSCSATQVETVTVNTNDDASFTVSNWCEGSANTISNIGTNGGTFAFNPAPSDGATIDATTGVINNATPGSSYTIEYTTPVGPCQATSTQTVTYNASPSVNAGSDINVCENESVTLNGSGAISYNWNNGITDGVSFVPSATGTTTYTVSGTDANGCVNTDQVDVTVNALPTANAGSTQEITCTSASVTLNGSSTTTGAVFSWNGPGIVSGGNTSSPTVNASGTYTLTVTDPLSSCDATATVAVTENTTAPNVNAGPDTTVCASSSTVTLSASGADAYSWDNGAGTGQSVTVSPTSTTTYTVTGTSSSNGCTATDAITVNVTSCAGIEEMTAGMVSIYPNPTKDVVTIEVSGTFNYTVFDSRGRLISAASAYDQATVDLIDVEAGVYLIRIQQGSQTGVYRVVKK